MPYLKLLNRRRELVRGRPRPTASGNFITLRKSGTVYSLTYVPVSPPYVFYILYVAPQPMPIGYINNPPMKPPFVLIGAQTDPQSLVPPDLAAPISAPPVVVPPAASQAPVIQAAPIVQEPLPIAATASQIAAYSAGNSFKVIPGQSPKKIVNGSVSTKVILIVAPSSNSQPVFIGFSPQMSKDTGMELEPATGFVIPLDDLSSVYLLAQNNTDYITGVYLV